MTDSTPEFDIILFGATGFAGELVVEHFIQTDEALTWAMAGRNESKLKALRDRLSATYPKLADIPLVIADSSDRASLDAMASRARVICSTVGPYSEYGSELVAACVEHGAHYCDLTGEVQWVRAMIEAHHERAREKGTRIVTCCGFDSIPSDLGTLLVQQHALKTHERPCNEVTSYVARVRGGFSGGTVASMITTLEQARSDRSVLKILGHPYSLNPEGERKGPDGSDQQWLRYDEDAQTWTAPFIMASVNSKVVRRSNALLDYKYGEDFRYTETMKMGDGPAGFARALAMSTGIAGFMLALMGAPSRKLLEKFVLPSPGEGPSREDIEAGFFEFHVWGHLPGEAQPIKAKVRGERDPGYGATAIMLGEAAICLALDELESQGGVLTPASAMGEALIERLRAEGMTFEIL